MLSVKTLFDGRVAGDLRATIALNLEGEPFWIRIADANLTMARGEIEGADVTLDTDKATLLSLMQTDRSIDDALATGHVRLTGDRAVVDTFHQSVSGIRASDLR
jgi:alkyl sulfatase BDS1-like metallo-beta-lactamase superfamily hydrolase